MVIHSNVDAADFFSIYCPSCIIIPLNKENIIAGPEGFDPSTSGFLLRLNRRQALCPC